MQYAYNDFEKALVPIIPLAIIEACIPFVQQFVWSQVVWAETYEVIQYMQVTGLVVGGVCSLLIRIILGLWATSILPMGAKKGRWFLLILALGWIGAIITLLIALLCPHRELQVADAPATN